ncbi:hypothetical protein CP973_20940 [Streptomyces albofaciens JCM 4342]|nr:hypothetical protein CP973_20940 [Streptomyces albofaciens JCM 4342]
MRCSAGLVSSVWSVELGASCWWRCAHQTDALHGDFLLAFVNGGGCARGRAEHSSQQERAQAAS